MWWRSPCALSHVSPERRPKGWRDSDLLISTFFDTISRSLNRNFLVAVALACPRLWLRHNESTL